MLTPEQKSLAQKLMREYLGAQNPDGTTPLEVQTQRDKLRIELIESKLMPLVQGFLSGSVPLADFKSQIDGLNKRHEYWGFKGIKGQMFFNMVVNVAESDEECATELKAAIALPDSEEMAKSRLKTFISYVKRISDEFVDAGGTRYGCPKIGSAPFFLSYFWQIQAPKDWPVYYTNSVNTMTDLNLWQAKEDAGDNYISFKHVHEELGQLFSKESGKRFGLYEVEHVFWYKGGNPYGGDKPLSNENADEATLRNDIASESSPSRLPDSYVPPIISILPRIAINDPTLVDAAQKSGTSLERAFEKNINAAFTMLGYDTRLLGQGKGRVPDGLAMDIHENDYAIIWDAKVRKDGYSMGTDDRTIREYVLTQSRELKRRRSLRNIYYAIISSSFKDDYDDAIRSLKMETDVNEVCLIEADAIVAMVDAKLRDPQQLDLGPLGLQRLFCASGILSKETVRETFV